MSHELRTPLNSIIGFTGTMLMKLPGELTEDQERQLQLIQFSARHLLSLINDLLNLAKVQSGKTELQLERVACRPIVQEIGATFRPGAGAKGLRFEVGLPSREVEIHSDRRTLLQILLNLAGNAIKFTEQGTVRVDLEELSPVPGKRREVAFRVTDTGIGIRREDQGRLFQPFEQFHAKRSEADPGSGLGLHLSQRMAYRLGGKIDFTSERRLMILRRPFAILHVAADRAWSNGAEPFGVIEEAEIFFDLNVPKVVPVPELGRIHLVEKPRQFALAWDLFISASPFDAEPDVF